MRFSFKVIVSLFLFVSIAAAQELTREQKFQKIDELNNQIKLLESDVLLPSAKDLKQAQNENLNVFRLMPREKYDRKFTVQGGGSYYSFTTRSHDYQKIAEIGLEQNNLKVGFAGADYGFINDLGERPIAEVDAETAEVNFLVNYKPPPEEPEIRIEQRKAWKYETDNAVYKNYFPAVVGHTYVLRAISFERADSLVAFKVYRKDTDGSLIIFWKNIKKFETPKIARLKSFVNSAEITVETTDAETSNAVQDALNRKGFFSISVEATNKEVILRGTVPKGKIGEAVRIAQETSKRKIANHITEQ